MDAPNHEFAAYAAAGHFSSLLKHWRSVRRLTQIELAADANVSARHRVLSGNRPVAAEPRDGAVARQRARSAARGEERAACRGGLRAALRRQGAGGRKSAAGAAGAGFHSSAAGAVSGDRRSTGTGTFASATRRSGAPAQAVSRFTTRWKTGLRTTPCTSFFIQGPAAVHAELGRVRPAR